MNSLEIISFTKDLRTNTDVIYAQIKIEDYLTLVGKDFDRFEIQRKREKHKGYNRLKRDIEKGALIPAITLAIEPDIIGSFAESLKQENREELIKKLFQHPDKIYILDGLQRTYIINDLKEGGTLFNSSQRLLLEIWFEPNINHLIYRLIVLNSGQKPMSMRHQIELLFITMRETLIKEVAGLGVLQEKDENRRSKPKEYPFESLVTAYKSYLTKSPEIDKDNIIAEKMIESDILDSEEEFLSESFLKFKGTLKMYALIDEQSFRIYNNSQLTTFKNWFADSNVINSFFAAVSKYSIDERREQTVLKSLEKLLKKLSSESNGSDPIELAKFSEIRTVKANPKLYNVGFATRKLLTSGFIEFLRSEGDLPFGECWMISSSEL